MNWPMTILSTELDQEIVNQFSKFSNWTHSYLTFQASLVQIASRVYDFYSRKGTNNSLPRKSEASSSNFPMWKHLAMAVQMLSLDLRH
jgi:hypothetical protein